MVWLINWKWFDRIIITVILGNSISLCLDDHNDIWFGEKYWSPINLELSKIDLIFTAIFILECSTKLIGMGFIMHKNAYLKDPWNWLDFFVVSISVLQFFNFGGKGLKALRTFRILRPLRTVNRFPKMKALITTLANSMMGLVGVIIFMGLLFVLFAIFGI